MDAGGTGVPSDARLANAIAASHLGSLDPGCLARLLAGVAHPAATPPAASSDGSARAAPTSSSCSSGLIRAEVSSPDGRSLAIRYAHPGRPPRRGVAVRPAVHDAGLAPRAGRLGAARAPAGRRPAARPPRDRGRERAPRRAQRARRRVRRRDPRQRLHDGPPADRPPPPPPRDGAAGRPGARRPGHPAALADAVGTVREVVVRELRGLREERVVETGSGSITILDPGRLADDADETIATGWNPGS